MKVLRFTNAVLLTALVLCVAWAATPSSMFLQPISLTLDGDRLTFVRATPFGDVTVEWRGEITLLDRDNFECHGNGRAIVQQQSNDLVTAQVSGWARACVDGGPPFVLRYQYQVLLLGLVPLRPVNIATTVNLRGSA